MKLKRGYLFAALIGVAGMLAACSKPEAPAAGGGEEGRPPSRVRRGANGETILMLDDAMQKQIGLKVEPLAAAQLSPGTKGYGRVLDPEPLAAVAADFLTAQAAREASRAELERLRVLAAQDNASQRALQSAEAAAARDEAQLASARLKLQSGWGALADRPDLAALIQSLGTRESALVRIDLPAGETVAAPPARAQLVALTDEADSIGAALIGPAPGVDPQTQGRGFLFLVQPNAARLAPGAAVTGYLPVSGEPLQGAMVPRPAVVRHQGAGWVYVETGGTNFTRRLILLGQPTRDGWFVTNGVAAGDHVVVTGAQTVFSEELNGSGFMSGGRD